MSRLIRMIRLAFLRSRLARVAHAIEEVEHYQAHHAANLERLLRAAANLRADIWFTENPRPAAGTTLRSLNAPSSIRGRA
jgi:hypothetical protein